MYFSLNFLDFSVPYSENDEEDEEDIETELICLSKGGIEKIECYDHDKRERERFEMLEDHTKEVIKKIEDHEGIFFMLAKVFLDQDGNFSDCKYGFWKFTEGQGVRHETSR